MHTQSISNEYFNIAFICLLNHRQLTSYLLSAILKSSLTFYRPLSHTHLQAIASDIRIYRQFVTSKSIKYKVKSSFRCVRVSSLQSKLSPIDSHVDMFLLYLFIVLLAPLSTYAVPPVRDCQHACDSAKAFRILCVRDKFPIGKRTI